MSFGQPMLGPPTMKRAPPRRTQYQPRLFRPHGRLCRATRRAGPPRCPRQERPRRTAASLQRRAKRHHQQPWQADQGSSSVRRPHVTPKGLPDREPGLHAVQGDQKPILELGQQIYEPVGPDRIAIVVDRVGANRAARTTTSTASHASTGIAIAKSTSSSAATSHGGWTGFELPERWQRATSQPGSGTR